jgi:glutathione S-transferase/GST-like protein
MLALYHWEPSLDSGEPIVCLLEKQLPFESHYVDLLELQQHQAEFLQLNPRGQIPVLVHDGRIITETGLLLQYIEDAFPAPSLLPPSLAARYQVHFWLKYVEERMAPAITLLGWHEIAHPTLEPTWLARARRSSEALPPERRRHWEQALANECAAEELALARESLAAASARLEESLSGSAWLAGASYSLADIALLFAVRALRAITPELVNTVRTPHTLGWLERLGQRPAVKEALARARTQRPDRAFVPGPERVRWG